MKKGFTLIELIAVILILATIGLIVFPIVNGTIKSNKEKLYNAQIKEIELACEKWAYANIDLLPLDGNSITLTIYELKRMGFLPIDMHNPMNDEIIPNDMRITISNLNGNYKYNVLENSGTNYITDINENSPIIVLNGNPLEYVEMGSSYNEFGAQAKDRYGNVLPVTIIYNYNDTQVAQIQTNDFKTYTVNYSTTYNLNNENYVSSITRTIIIRDTLKPVISVPSQVTLTLREALNYDVLDGVSVSDNSNEEITIIASNLNIAVGKQIVTYSACDSSNNCESKRRIINITE